MLSCNPMFQYKGNNIHTPHVNKDAYEACLMAEMNFPKSETQNLIHLNELKRENLFLREENEFLEKENLLLREEISRLKQEYSCSKCEWKNEIKSLHEEIFFLKRYIHSPKTEEIPKDQLVLDIFPSLPEEFPIENDTKKEDNDSNDDNKPLPKPKKGKRSPKIKSIPDFLARKEIVIDIEDGNRLCKDDNHPMILSETKVHEKLVVIPAQYYVEKYIIKNYKCAFCHQEHVPTCPSMGVLAKTQGSPSLFTQIIMAKFCDGLPIYRYEKVLRRQEINISRQTIYRWIDELHNLVIPIINLMRDSLLESGYIQMDETPFQVNKEKDRKASSKSYMWVQAAKVQDNVIVLYDYRPTRSGDVPIEILEGFTGYLQVDGYIGYSPFIKESKGNVIRVGCWDHCRRKFFEAYKISGGKGIANDFLYLIKCLYEIERDIKDLSFDEKLSIRKEKSVPVLDKFHKMLISQKDNFISEHRINEAITYALNEWPHLTVYTTNGRLNISNILTENKIRPFAVGRRAWLFSDGPNGADSMAAFYSLAITANSNEIPPDKYFNKLFTLLPQCNTTDDYQKLLPLKENFVKNSS